MDKADQIECANNYDSWKAPEKKPDTYLTGLYVNNSLYPSKLVELIPTQGKRINWYMCGPTVYDAAHLGHARTYLSFDMIKKVLRDYFGYDVVLCENVTDIDDKIIIKSNEAKEDFAKFARKWENDFFEDMGLLNVELPDMITRVSEYVPEIVKFIAKIIENGYAYESKGSVYFDVDRYSKSGKHVYGKLAPNSVNDESLIKEAEGALTSGESEKRTTRDFALWKKSKPGEPKWASPWGDGRPGWHIECSAMCSNIFGGHLDIHSGGVDLKFPHHENEIAQTEAHFDHHQWINYFFHSGHLNIEGLKMSKSLKNFIKIKSLLQVYNARQLRLLFLLHKYDVVMNYTESSMTEAVEKDKRYTEFFLNLKANMRVHGITEEQKWNEKDFELFNLFQEKKKLVHQHLCNNFYTPGVIHDIDILISAVNTYMSKDPIKYPLLNSIGDYIIFIYKCLGLAYEKKKPQGGEEAKNQNVEEIVTPYVDALANFREKVREAGKAKDTVGVLRFCDEVRDETLPTLGIRLEDKAQGTLWKYEDKDVLLKEKEAKAADAVKKQEEKLKKQEEDAIKKAQLEEQSKIHPEKMYIHQTDVYSKFDEKGVPTHDKEGKELTKNLVKKLKKDWDNQEKLHQGWLAKQEKKE
jgi:cysteinyl-tRNA synthetase